MRHRFITALVSIIALSVGPMALADAGASCKDVRFVQVNWTGVSVKTETAEWMLKQLGYKTDVITASVPIMFQSLATNQRDAALGLWLPTQRSMIKKYMEDGKIDMVTANLTGAKYTLAVPHYVYAAGVKNFSDLNKHKDKFGGKVYGIEAGNDGNRIVKKMISDNAYDLSGWQLVPSSEAGMLAQVHRAIARKEWIVFLGWAPHPMNINMHINYLAGGAKYWGPNKGGATVYTITRTGYGWKCPNVGQFLQNYKWTVDQQSHADDYVINHNMDYAAAGKALIKKHPELLNEWFGHGGAFQTGPVLTADGKQDALPIIKKALGM